MRKIPHFTHLLKDRPVLVEKIKSSFYRFLHK